MKRQLEQVMEFHTAFGSHIGETPTMPSDPERLLRAGLVIEEAFELDKELLTGKNMPLVAKELIDLLYVTLGTAISFGLQSELERCFDAVHASNMSKLGEDGSPVYREDGKVLKGPNYKPADLSFLNNENPAK